MTYKRYEKYKDSGVEWIGEIPEDWSCIDFRRYTYLQQGLQIAQEKRFHKYKEGRKVYLTVKFLNSKNQENEIEYIQDASSNVICNKSDVLLGRTGATGKVVTDVEGVFHNNFFKINYDKNKLIREFLVYYLTQNNIQDHFKLVSGTTTIPDLNHGEFLSTKLILPTNINEQKSIVKFLDEKTTEIDILIQDKEKLIEFLKEQRQAIIIEAVTKGLDKNVSMKDSGVEWIGKVPEHWIVTSLKHIASNEKYSIVDGPFGSDMKNEEYVDSGTPIIQLNNIGEGIHKLENIKFITSEKAECLYRHTIYPGEIVIAKMMPAGRATIVSSRFDKYIVSSDSIRLKLNNKNEYRFIVYCLNIYGTREANMQSNGTTRSRINLSIVKNLHLVIPKLEEQKEIADFLEKKISEIDSLIKDVKVSINNLNEYKQSLISEVITGKIDVRN